jgi:hypothetical protein
MGPMQQFMSYNELLWLSSDIIDIYIILRCGLEYEKLNTTRLVMILQGRDMCQCSLTSSLGGTMKSAFITRYELLIQENLKWISNISSGV